MAHASIIITAAGALLASCSGNTNVVRPVVGLTPGGDFVGQVQSVAQRRFSGVIRQKFDFSCGSAALATLLHHHYGAQVDEAEVFKGMWRAGDQAQIRRLGFSFLDMKRYLGERSLDANGFKVTLDEVAKGNTPGIALLNIKGYKHFVVVKGVRNGEVLVGDPSTGLRILTATAFNSSWNGVYFIISPDKQPGRFNASTHWAAFTRAPVGNMFSQPLSQQALALTAPFYRDF